MTEELEMIVFSIVGNAGEAKSLAQEALTFSFNGKFDEANELLKKSNEAILKAHAIQTDLIQKEAGGEPTPISMLFVHAQDHLMTAISEKELIKKMILQNKRIFELEKLIKIK
ncbi:PTS lactose/cellobiose transporter subunit IIA (plasmid) [Cetobacterium somerae]|uniref:PTS lactose/cellobiose transporter subunit IIA n=1 Tax=Cetobacterium somerae TaxID=188913 RepID=UPI003D766F05